MMKQKAIEAINQLDDIWLHAVIGVGEKCGVSVMFGQPDDFNPSLAYAWIAMLIVDLEQCQTKIREMIRPECREAFVKALNDTFLQLKAMQAEHAEHAATKDAIAGVG